MLICICYSHAEGCVAELADVTVFAKSFLYHSCVRMILGYYVYSGTTVIIPSVTPNIPILQTIAKYKVSQIKH